MPNLACRAALSLSCGLALVGTAAAQPLNFDVFAGSPPSAGSDDGTGTAARFFLVTDSAPAGEGPAESYGG
jgi:hypothetical protein